MFKAGPGPISLAVSGWELEGLMVAPVPRYDYPWLGTGDFGDCTGLWGLHRFALKLIGNELSGYST